MSFRFQPQVRTLPEAPPPQDALLRLASRRLPVLLDSAKGWPRRFSLLAFDPLCEADGRVSSAHDLASLRALAARLEPGGGEVPPSTFAGGFVGALSYDLGVAGEGQVLPAEPWGFPGIVGGLYVDYLVWDHETGRCQLVLGREPGDGRAALGEREEGVRAALAEAVRPAGVRAAGPLERHVTRAEHQARIEALRAGIGQGELYQANLAHRFTRRVEGEPEDLYCALRRANAAPYMGYARWRTEDGLGAPGALLSSSPELLLEVDGARARTRPIKGTIRRAAEPERDAELARSLLASEKDRAELAMIVDLERNDLGRVAEPGSVRTVGFPTLRSYARVHHLTADVEARLAAGRDAWNALGALFPGGSITGAPKLASMEWIARLEGEGRGFFCGALGASDLRGRARWNVLIRTLLWRGIDSGAGEVSLRVGGGITWASSPADEDRETLDKGAALFAALEESPPGGASAKEEWEA